MASNSILGIVFLAAVSDFPDSACLTANDVNNIDISEA